MAKYFLIEEQDEDWKPIVKNFASQACLDGWTEPVAGTPGYGKTKLMLSGKAEKAGYNSPQQLFNDWINKKGVYGV